MNQETFNCATELNTKINQHQENIKLAEVLSKHGEAKDAYDVNLYCRSNDCGLHFNIDAKTFTDFVFAISKENLDKLFSELDKL